MEVLTRNQEQNQSNQGIVVALVIVRRGVQNVRSVIRVFVFERRERVLNVVNRVILSGIAQKDLLQHVLDVVNGVTIWRTAQKDLKQERYYQPEKGKGYRMKFSWQRRFTNYRCKKK